MADKLNSTPVPKCTRATTAINAIARARSLGHGAFLALEGAGDERMGLAVGAVVHAMMTEPSAAEAALFECGDVSAMLDPTTFVS